MGEIILATVLMELGEAVIQELQRHLGGLLALKEMLVELLTIDDIDGAGLVGTDGDGSSIAVVAIREVGHKLALEGEARAVVLALLVVVHHVLEAAPLHVCHPLRRLARLLQRLAPLERPLLAMLLTILPQELKVQPLLVGIKVLVHCHIRQLFDSWVQR